MQRLITTIFLGNTNLSVESKGLIADGAPTATLLTSAFKHMDLIVRSEDIDDSTELFNVSAFVGKDRVARLELATREVTRSLLSLSESQLREIQRTGATRDLMVYNRFLVERVDESERQARTLRTLA
jgi:dynactin complex subunit